MRPSSQYLPLPFLILIASSTSSAFQSTPQQTSSLTSFLLCQQNNYAASATSLAFLQHPDEKHQHQRRALSTRLRYRELDEDDADTNTAADAMLKVRAPLGFDMKENLLNKKKLQQPNSAMNLPLIRAFLFNQGLILGLASMASAAIVFVTYGVDGVLQLSDIYNWSGGGGEPVVDSNVLRLLIGIAAAVPTVLLSNRVEDSDNRALANINFSTITMVMTLFGRRTQPPDEFLPKQFKGRTIPTTKTMDVLI